MWGGAFFCKEMMRLEQRLYPVSPAGQVELRREGLFTRLRFTGGAPAGVVRLWFCTPEACRRVGVPVPRDGRLALERRLSPAQAAELGLWQEGEWILSPDGTVLYADIPGLGEGFSSTALKSGAERRRA